MFALLAQVTIRQTTEGGETWPKDTSEPMARTTTPVQQATQARPQIGTDAGERKNAQPADAKVTTQETAELNRTMNSGAPGATEITTATTHADWPTQTQYTQIQRQLPPTSFPMHRR